MTDLHLSRRAFIGFEPLLDSFNNLMSVSTDNYPPYNIAKESNNKYTIEIAVAGFTIDDIDLEELNNVLTITGNRDKHRSADKYIHKGISAKKFTKVFKLAEDAKVTNANLANGILSINIEIKVPKAAKANKIKVKGL